MKLEFSRQIFEESLNIKFHENPSSWSRVVSCVRTDGWTDMTKLIVAFHNFASAPKKGVFSHLTIEKISFRQTFLKCSDSFYLFMEFGIKWTTYMPHTVKLWVMTACTLFGGYQYFEEIFFLTYQDRNGSIKFPEIFAALSHTVYT
jgi:hypothetical protein